MLWVLSQHQPHMFVQQYGRYECLLIDKQQQTNQKIKAFSRAMLDIIFRLSLDWFKLNVMPYFQGK